MCAGLSLEGGGRRFVCRHGDGGRRELMGLDFGGMWKGEEMGDGAVLKAGRCGRIGMVRWSKKLTGQLPSWVEGRWPATKTPVGFSSSAPGRRANRTRDLPGGGQRGGGAFCPCPRPPPLHHWRFGGGW